jgi:hypothetical protein
MTTLAEPLIGSQRPTHLWHPPFRETMGGEAIALYQSAGSQLDEWQRLGVNVIMALGRGRAWNTFENGVIVSRQNGKGEVLITLELAWLILLNEKLITHSAHLFETTREHFLKIQAILVNTAHLLKRVDDIREGRGSEEIIMKARPCPRAGCCPAGKHRARLKFMSRKGGAGRGFTGGKLVLDEAMYLDADMMAAGLPMMSTRPDAQVVYAGSAGMKHSTQLALVRKRGLAQEDGISLLMWEAEQARYDEYDRLVSGDDPSDPRTHAKVNPTYGIRISAESVEREAKAFGGYDSMAFATERLGIGDYPEDETERWEIFPKTQWRDAEDRESVLPDDGRARAIGIANDKGITTLTICGYRLDSRQHVEVIARHRGTAWVLDKLLGKSEEPHPTYGRLDLWERLGRPYLLCLRNDEATEVGEKLARLLLPKQMPDDQKRRPFVSFPTEGEYAAGCASFAEAVRTGRLAHIGQASLTAAVAGASKRLNTEGGWRWNRDVTTEQAPAVSATLAKIGLDRYGTRKPKSRVW